MQRRDYLSRGLFISLLAVVSGGLVTEAQTNVTRSIPPFPLDPKQHLERTCFQTGGPYRATANLRSDVAIVYGIDAGLPGNQKQEIIIVIKYLNSQFFGLSL